MNDKQTIEATMKWAHNKSFSYEQKYNETGSASTLQMWERYQDIEDICRLAYNSQDEEDIDKAKGLKNIAFIKDEIKSKATNHIKADYTSDEVIEIINNIERML